jgi:hypothetical protein
LKDLEALFDHTTTARIVALPAAGEVVIAVEVLPVSQYDLMMISGNYGEATCPPIWAQKGSAARSQWQRSERRRAGSQQNESRGASTRRRLNLPEIVTDMLIERSDDNG